VVCPEVFFEKKEEIISMVNESIERNWNGKSLEVEMNKKRKEKLMPRGLLITWSRAYEQQN